MTSRAHTGIIDIQTQQPLETLAGKAAEQTAA
jgi:hypothetical protein